MSYGSGEGGGIDPDGSIAGSIGEAPAFWTWDQVEERLIEAVSCWRRMPDRERGWQRVCARWPELKHFGEHVNVAGEFSEREADPKPRRPSLTRGEIAAMEEATEWLTWIAGEAQRRTLVAGLVDRAKGNKQVGWTALRERLGMPETPAALEWRYARAVRFIASVLNAKVGHGYRTRRGAAAGWPADVRAAVERLKMAENCGRNVSTPKMCSK